MRLLASLLLLAVQVSCKDPVSRVSRLLQQMQERVSKQGQVESKLWDETKGFCKTNMDSFEEEITRIEKRLPLIQSEISLAAAQQVRLKADKDTAEKEHVDAQSTMNGARALRQSESKEYDRARSETLRNLASIDKAIAAMKNGGGASFLQTGDADLVRQLVATANLRVSDRDALSAALMPDGSMEPSSSIAVGILKSMRETMDEDQKSADRREAAAVASFLAMSRAKSAQIAALDGEIETKTTRIGELQVDMANKQADLDQSEETRSRNKKMLDDLTSSCTSQEKEWTSRSQLRAEEMKAIQETLEILSSEQARQVFDQSGGAASPALAPAPWMSFLQVRRAKTSLASQGGNDALALLALASRSDLIDFSQVTRKVDDMVQVLKREEVADDKKREWCIAEMLSSKDNLKTLAKDTEDLSTMMREVQNEVAKTAQDLSAITSYIKALDAKIDWATKNRKAENQEYKEATLTNNKARELLLMAKDRLRRFYATEEAAKHGVTLLARRQSVAARMAAATAAIASAGDGLRVASENAVELAPPSLVQMSSLRGRSSPKAFSAYQVQSESGRHILSMLDVIVADLDRDQKALDEQEANAQGGYEKITKDAQELREEGTLHAAQKSNVRASFEKRYESLDRKNVTTLDEQFGVEMYVAGLKRECTFLLENFEARKSARAGQLESLGRAQKVLTEQR